MLDTFDANLLFWIPSVPGSIWPGLAVGVSVCVIITTAAIFWTARKRKASKPTAAPKQPNNNTAIDYDSLLAGIEKLNGKAQCLLFAANGIKDLPVTVPVQIGVRLAQSRRCLLIDLDLKRNAVAQVFGLDETEASPPTAIRSVPTEFENLFVWPAAHFKRQGHMNIKQLVERAGRQYDQVLIYAPYLTTLPDRRQVASVCTNAYSFGNGKDNRLKRLLDACKCPVAREF